MFLSRSVIVVKVLTFSGLLIFVRNVRGEFNASEQQPHHFKHANPIVRNVEYASGTGTHNFGNRLAVGGKYRSSYYFPKSLPSSTPNPGRPSPMWVVVGRQGAPFDDYGNPYETNDVQPYAVPADYYYGSTNYNKNNNYDLYNENVNDVYQQELASIPSGWSWTRADTDSDTSEELFNEREDMDDITEDQIQGLMKTRRMGFKASLGGLLSLKGLKLSALGFFYLFRGLVILAWKFLPWIFLVVVALMFIPVPIITIPAAAGRSGGLLNMNMTEVAATFSNIIDQIEGSEQCMERMACELRRGSRNAWFQPPLKLLIYNYQSKLPGIFQKMAKAYIQRRRCRLYRCLLYNPGFS